MLDKGFESSADNISSLNLTVAIVRSSYNSKFTVPLAEKCCARLIERGVKDSSIIQVAVPGSLEIAYALSLLAKKTPRPDVMIAIGSIVRGDTFHFDVVALQSAASIYDVQLAVDIPVINGILTTDNLEQAFVRVPRGKEFADTAIDMAIIKRQVG